MFKASWRGIHYLLVGILLLVTTNGILESAIQENGLALEVRNGFLPRTSLSNGMAISSGIIETGKCSEIYLKGIDSLRVGSGQSGIELLNESKRIRCRTDLASGNLAVYYEKTDQFPKAVDEWKASAYSEKAALNYYHKATVYFQDQDYQDGVSFALFASELDSQFAKPYWLLASFYHTRDNQKMVEILKQGLQRDSSSAWSYIARGLIAEYPNEGKVDSEAVIGYYLKALELNPNEPYARKRLIDFATRTGHLPEIEKLLPPEKIEK
jgi:tetratricopeptide (TPR) repeat protein